MRDSSEGLFERRDESTSLSLGIIEGETQPKNAVIQRNAEFAQQSVGVEVSLTGRNVVLGKGDGH